MLFTEETILYEESILYDPQDAVHPHNSFLLPPSPSLVCSGQSKYTIPLEFRKRQKRHAPFGLREDD